MYPGRLEGQVAIVTGGQGMLGSGYVEALAKAGAKVAIFDIRKDDAPVIARLKAEALVNVISLVVDITNPVAVRKAFYDVGWRFGGGDNGKLNGVPNILVNNAGIDVPPHGTNKNAHPRFENYQPEFFRDVLNSHLTGALVVAQEFVKHFRATQKSDGSIINVSSIYGVVSPDQKVYDCYREGGKEFYKPVSYTVAKAGMVGFTKWLVGYFAYEKLPIRANTLVLGGVQIPDHDPEFLVEYKKHVPLGRMARPGEYNEAVLFLASDASSYMTGSELVLDGGYTAR